jgi:3-hydroxyacyl-[acyl-carrier-protein] dehydratase
MQAMPHGHPMLLLDEAGPGADADSAVSFKNITFNEPCYSGVAGATALHQLAYPLALLVESFGQGAGLLLARHGFLAGTQSSTAVVFGEFTDIDILGSAYPGERLRHEVRLTLCKGPLAVLSGVSCVGERVIARFGRLLALRVPAQPSLDEGAP